jgi:hypothetical protein
MVLLPSLVLDDFWPKPCDMVKKFSHGAPFHSFEHIYQNLMAQNPEHGVNRRQTFKSPEENDKSRDLAKRFTTTETFLVWLT